MGLLTGTVLGAGLGMLLAPKAGSELRGAIGEQARTWSNAATEQVKKASDAAGPWVERGREMVDKAKEAVSRGADEARSYASGTTGSSYSSDNTGNTGSPFGSGTTGGNSGGSDFGRS
jgi:gas vesicle protein